MASVVFLRPMWTGYAISPGISNRVFLNHGIVRRVFITREILEILHPHDILLHIEADGIVIVEGAATSQTIDSVLEEYGEHHDGQNFALAGKSATFATKLLMHPLFIDLSKRILTDTYVVYYENERTVSTSYPQVSQTSLVLPSKSVNEEDDFRRVFNVTVTPSKIRLRLIARLMQVTLLNRTYYTGFSGLLRARAST
ncbi:hypothetical protein LTR22_026197 [Elasticomyces elasticus]|nr:hypothetical protein LTR22_026197 [Elasticomyces elasticus]